MKYVAKQVEQNKRTCCVCDAVFFAFPSSGNKTCGALTCSVEARKNRGKRHGDSYTRLHAIWCGMKSRCLNNKRYRHLTVCAAWQTYESFRDWAMLSGYTDALEIDRKENTKGYCPDNCRWATRVQQMQNTGIRKHRNKTSQYRGVQRMPHLKTKPWRTIATHKGKPKHLGLFETEVEAAKAYDAWAKIEFGEFANLNFKEA
jgi:hypothetical protein